MQIMPYISRQIELCIYYKDINTVLSNENHKHLQEGIKSKNNVKKNGKLI